MQEFLCALIIVTKSLMQDITLLNEIGYLAPFLIQQICCQEIFVTPNSEQKHMFNTALICLRVKIMSLQKSLPNRYITI